MQVTSSNGTFYSPYFVNNTSSYDYVTRSYSYSLTVTNVEDPQLQNVFKIQTDCYDVNHQYVRIIPAKLYFHRPKYSEFF